jgi:integrase
LHNCTKNDQVATKKIVAAIGDFFMESLNCPVMYLIAYNRRMNEFSIGFHAIRHLSASILFKLGYELGVIQAILRHKSPGTTERYLRSIGLERVRDALEDLSQGKGKVVEFKTRTRDVAKVDAEK